MVVLRCVVGFSVLEEIHLVSEVLDLESEGAVLVLEPGHPVNEGGEFVLEGAVGH